MAFKRIATLNVQTVYAADKNNKFEWRSFVKNANEEPSKICKLPLDAYKFDTNNFLYLTARMISGGEKWGCNGNYDYFPWEEIKKAANTAIGKGFYIEHKEDSFEDAKGLILDVFPNDEEEFLVALCAIDKNEFPEFIQQILDGTYNQVSMSCLASECECSLCHNVAHSFDDLCQHMNVNFPITYLKGKKDDRGNDIYEINRDLCFTGLSSVAVPADKDAFVFDIKASKNKQNKLKEEFNKYMAIKQAGKMKEFKMACEEQFKALSNVDLLNKLQNCATAITNQVVDQQNDVNIINGPLQGILRQLMELQIGLTVLDLNKLTPSINNTVAVEGKPETEVAEVTTNVEEKDGEGHLLTEDDLDVVNLDKEIDSMLEEPTKGISKLLKNKYFKNEDELESIIKSHMVGAEVLDSDSDGIIVKVLEEDGKHTYKIYLLGNSGPSEVIKVEKVEELDSQEANFDKEIESYDNWSYTPFSSTAKVKKQAGTWAFPKNPLQANKLKELMSNPIYDTEELYNIFGDDVLFDKIDNLKSKQDIRPLIIERLKEFLPETKDNKTKTILEEIVGEKIPYIHTEEDKENENTRRRLDRKIKKTYDELKELKKQKTPEELRAIYKKLYKGTGLDKDSDFIDELIKDTY